MLTVPATITCPGCARTIPTIRAACAICLATVPIHLVRTLNQAGRSEDVVTYLNARDAVREWLATPTQPATT